MSFLENQNLMFEYWASIPASFPITRVFGRYVIIRQVRAIRAAERDLMVCTAFGRRQLKIGHSCESNYVIDNYRWIVYNNASLLLWEISQLAFR